VKSNKSNISETINPIKSKFEGKAEANNYTLWVVYITNITHIKSNMAAGHHLKNWRDVITPPIYQSCCLSVYQ